MALFEYGDFISHSGKTLPFKIECAALSCQDLYCLAQIGYKLAKAAMLPHTNFIGVPKGGMIFAVFLNRCALAEGLYDKNSQCTVVDDVYTTGSSIRGYMKKYNSRNGLVIFSRTQFLPYGIESLFQLNRNVIL